MIIETPNIINVTLYTDEKIIIEKCCDLLTKIQQEMSEYDCSMLEDSNGDVCSIMRMYDIKRDLMIISDAQVMLDD